MGKEKRVFKNILQITQRKMKKHDGIQMAKGNTLRNLRTQRIREPLS